MTGLKRTVFAVWLLTAVVLAPVRGGAAPCTEPLPALFDRVSKSVVLITAVGINPFSLEERITTSVGSGFIIRPDGLILTNAHVVFGRQQVSVTLDDGRTVTAAVDPILDLAVLKLERPLKEFPTLPLAASELPAIGEEVVAVGNPLGLEQTLTRGVVSGVNRILPVSPMSLTIPMIQTDAAINPGNSGGPLVNRCGEVVGINTSVLQGAENIGFALPAVIVRKVLPELLEKGRIIRPWLGIRGKLIRRDELRRIFNLDLQDGFLVEMVEPGSPAENAGLVGGLMQVKVGDEEYLFGGDLITEVDGKPIVSPESYLEFAQNLKVGQGLNFTVVRDGKKKATVLTVLERPVLPWDLPPDECRNTMFWSEPK